MFILVVPMLSVDRLNHDSNYVILSETIPKILEAHPDWQMDILWPSNHSDWTYYRDGFFDHPRINRLPHFFHRHKMRQVGTFDVRAWDNHLSYKTGIYDVIWNNAPELAGHLKFMETNYDHSGKPDLFSIHHYVLHKSLPYPIDLGYRHQKLLQVHGAVLSDVNLVHSDHCWNMLHDNLIEHLAPKVVAEVEAKTENFSLGVLNPDDYKTPTRRNEKTVFAWNHRFQDYKGWRFVFDTFAEIWKRRQDFEVHYFGAKSLTVEKHPFVKHRGADNRNEYLKNLAKCDVNITNSKHETFCLAAIESMMFAQPLIAPQGVTFPEITGQSMGNGYPYLFQKKETLAGLIEHVIDNPTERKKWGKVVQEHVTTKYTADVTARNLGELIHRLGSHYDVVKQVKHLDDFKKLLASRDEWPIQDLRMAAYRGISSKGTKLAAGQSWPTLKLKRLANQLGWIDHRHPQQRLLLRKET